jgi:hypothetical protein
MYKPPTAANKAALIQSIGDYITDAPPRFIAYRTAPRTLAIKPKNIKPLAGEHKGLKSAKSGLAFNCKYTKISALRMHTKHIIWGVKC